MQTLIEVTRSRFQLSSILELLDLLLPLLQIIYGQLHLWVNLSKDFSANTRIKAIGTVRWNIRDSMGTSTSIKTTAYYIPEEDIRLFIPQG